MESEAEPNLGHDFFKQVEEVDDPALKIRWYYCVVVNLAALNYADVIPKVWEHCWRHLCKPLSHDEQFKLAQKMRESLIKATGIMGAARSGNAIRTLGNCIPDSLRDTEARRSRESRETAIRRGHEFHRRIYGRNPDYDLDATPSASPDYAFVVRDLLYGHVFSFDEILNDLETGFVIVSALIGLDCQTQLKNQSRGLVYNGTSEEEVRWVHELCMDVARRLGVTFRSTAKMNGDSEWSKR